VEESTLEPPVTTANDKLEISDMTTRSEYKDVWAPVSLRDSGLGVDRKLRGPLWGE
jgi:hypothetical protein